MDIRYLHKIFISLILSLIIISPAYSQSDITAKEIINQRIEELSAKTDMEFDFSEIYEHFLELYEHPININTADAEELRTLLFLNDNQIAILIDARNKNGGFQTIYELKELDGFYINLLKDIEPFITFDKTEKKEKLQLSRMLKYGKNQVIVRYGRVLEDQKGYAPISDQELAANPNRR
ncbi:MAG: hypothetical protein B6I18_05925 [Bacteroidetes bacterium 4572_112]|nr:MAG: hypothetical protein B6I18_05925 [Bacteroidetes bacterium 4572_112]